MLKKGKIMRSMVVGVVFAAILGVITGCGGEKKKETEGKKVVNVGIIQLAEHSALDAANKGFVKGLEDNGYKENVNIKFDRQNAQGDHSNLQNIANRFVSNKVDLICAISTPAAQSLANATKDIPIVGTAITDYVTAKLVVSNNEPKTNVTGTTNMNSIDKHIDLIMKIVPNTKQIGVIYNTSEINSQVQVRILKEFAAAKGLSVREATVTSVNDIQQAGQSLIAANVDVLYTPTDNVVASGMPVLASLANEAKIPIVCGEAAMVKNGGLVTIGIDYYKLGLQTGAMAARILDGKGKPAQMPIESQKELKTTINESTAAKIGVTIPQEILKGAEIVK